MPIFTKDNQAICFIHVPKCGGTSIAAQFAKIGWRVDYYDGKKKSHIAKIRRNSPQHSSVAQLDTIVDLDKVDFLFAFVRDPFARIVSEYKFQRAHKWINMGFQDWITPALDIATRDPTAFDSHLRPACDFLDPRVQIFRLETERPQLVAALNSHVPAFGDMPLTNTTTAPPADDFTLSPGLRDRIINLFRADFETYYPDVL